MTDSTAGKISKILGAFLALLLILSFALWGVGDVFRSSLMANKAAEVGERVISMEEYQNALSLERRRLEMQLGSQVTQEMLESYGIPQQTIAVMINQALLKQETDRFGIHLGTDPVVQAIRSDQRFLTKEGAFDRQLFDQSLRMYGYTEKSYVENIRADMERSLLMASFSASPPLTGTQGEALYRVREEQRDASVLTLTPAAVKDIPEPSEKELEAYYAKMKEKFATLETRDASLLMLFTDDIMGEMDFSEEALKTEYKFREDQFAAKEVRSLAQVIVQEEAKAKELRAQMDKKTGLKEAAKKAGIADDFSEVGKLTREDLEASGIIPKEVVDQVFSLEKGGTTQPFKTALGWHIIEVGAIDKGKSVSFTEAKAKLKEMLLKDKGGDLLYELSTRIEDKLAGGATVEEVAKEMKLTTVKVKGLRADGKHGPVEGTLPEFGEVAKLAFATEEGQVSSLTPNEDNTAYFLLQVDSVTPSRVKKLEEVRKEVVEAWKHEQRKAKLKALAEATAKKLKEGSTLEQEAAVLGAKISAVSRVRYKEPKEDVLPAAAAKELFHLAKGRTGAAWPQGEGYVILRLDSIIPPEEKGKSLAEASIGGELKEAFGQDIQEQLIIYLRIMHPVTQYVQ